MRPATSPVLNHKVSTVLVSLTARLFAMETLRYGACIGARPFVAHVRSVYYVCRSRRLCTRDPAAPPPWPLFACLPRDVHPQHRAFYDADPDATRPWTRTWAHSASRREWRRSRTRPHIGPEMKTVCEIRDVIWDSYLRTVDIKCR